ncbi:MAG: toprim domain-containing protein, partial [Pseudarcicella sp.]|nr:toprim domain-containing protein [Pseudarcicella sp.]
MDIQDIKKQLSITAVLHRYGITAIKNKQINCPFHEDKTPSMQVYEDKGLVYCHSSNCKCGGKLIDQIDFIMYKENCSKHEAIKKAESLITNQSITTPTKPAMTEEINYQDIFTKTQQCYIRNDKAQEYANSRNINNGKLQIGYNTATGTVFKALKNCIIFPLKNLQNEIVSLYGRNISDSDTNKHYYTANRKGLYHNTNNETQTLIITESIIDTATLQVFTDFETVALFGTNGFNEEHIELLKSLKNLSEIVFFLDGDQAGRSAVKNYELRIMNLLPNVKMSYVNTPDDEDINSL